MNVEKKNFGHRVVCVYKVTDRNAPLVYTIGYHEHGAELMETCTGLGCATFNLVTISGLNWNDELSPWPADGALLTQDDSFAGGADAFLKLLCEEIVPYAEAVSDVSPEFRCLSGYSMAGLFAVYAAFNTDIFSRFVSASGSLWYPGIVEYAQSQPFPAQLDSFYLSIGGRESRTRNLTLQTTETNTRKIAGILREKRIPVKFELNPGNHFRDAVLREAKGIRHVLGTPA